MTLDMRAALVLLVFTISHVSHAHAEGPVCSPSMAPAKCAEAQIVEISKVYGKYKEEIGILNDELKSLKSEMNDLKSQYSKLEGVVNTVLLETAPVRPGGSGCLLVREGNPMPGWQIKGYFGIVQFRPFDGGRVDAFKRGGQHAGDWWWEHGEIFCAK